ncbi:MAG TPA: lysophospholipid acyltransferase family protein [Polyangiaceae bacterium]|nr:lysophospholipid acyltransferase family protein [Polyangiaceae bacterium]
MTRKEKKKDKAGKAAMPASRKPSKPAPKKKTRASGKGKDKEKTKKQRQGELEYEPAPQTVAAAAPQPLAAEGLPRVDLDDAYDLTADGDSDSDDLEALSAAAPELGVGPRVVAPNLRFEAEDALESFSPPPSEGGDVEAQIRALEARLDGLIQGAARPEASTTVERSALANPPQTSESELESSAETIAVESAAELAESNYYVQKWGRKGLRSRAEEVDEFGLDRSFEAKLRPVLDFVYRRYFRIQTEGITNVPGEGRAVVVGNHSGSIPIDGLMLRTALRTDHPQRRDLRWLAEDFLFYLPFAGVAMNRAGAVRACQENAERLLSRDGLIAVFPEGVQGIRKLFRDRYRLQRFGRGGYIRLCLRTRAPLIPCAIIGGEESSPLLYRFDALADLLRIPYLPLTPTFPALGALGLLPAPTKWRIRFGEPIPFDNYGPEAADDDVLVGRLSDRVRSTIQSMLELGLAKRRSIWF